VLYIYPANLLKDLGEPLLYRRKLLVVYFKVLTCLIASLMLWYLRLLLEVAGKLV
jgi:hypothetical protein